MILITVKLEVAPGYLLPHTLQPDCDAVLWLLFPRERDKLTKMRTFACFLLATALLFATCKSAVSVSENPPAEGFDLSHSDPKAIVLADKVMQAMGGRAAWDQTRVIQWTFFGRRTLTWDKWTGDVRIEWLKRPLKILVNVNSGQGKVQIDGVEQTHPDSLSKYLDLGKKVWINDSYWLVMPFKLKDSGVTLKYLGATKTAEGKPAELLQMTFKGVGVTPDNKYHVWVDRQSKLVTYWAYFENFTDDKPEITNPWSDYRPYGNILLSGDRGKDRGTMTPIQVWDVPPPGIFDKF